MILITGATGTVGSEVVKRLSVQGIHARALTRDVAKVEADQFPHVEFVQGDFDDADSIRRACSGVEQAFLLSNSTERAEHRQTAFVEAARTSGVRHIVKLSQLHADVNSAGRFLRYHAAVETAIEATNLTFTFLRPNLYIQGLLNFAQGIKEKSAFFAAAGEERISAVDVLDLADVAVAALTDSQHKNKSYSLTGPEALTFGKIADELSAALGRTISFVDVPPEVMRGALEGLGFPAWQADGLLEEFEMYRRGEAAAIESEVTDALGRSPRPFAQFARDYAPLFA
jgi:uncharacterized protein YbjT (DUF2867 family)